MSGFNFSTIFSKLAFLQFQPQIFWFSIIREVVAVPAPPDLPSYLPSPACCRIAARTCTRICWLDSPSRGKVGVCRGRHEGIANVETYRERQGHTGPDRDRQGQTRISRNKHGQTGTSRGRKWNVPACPCLSLFVPALFLLVPALSLIVPACPCFVPGIDWHNW